MADLKDDDVALTKLLCTLLAQRTGWSWFEEGGFPADYDVAIVYGAAGDTPDRVVGVRVYGATDLTAEGYHWRRAQFRFRGERFRADGADELASATFAALNGLSRVGGINGISRQSMAPLGADKNGREERSDNYIIVLDNPEA